MEKISRRRFLKGTIALGAGALLSMYSDGSFRLALAQENPVLRMRILHTNDHHARIEPVFSDNNPVHGGVSRRKALIDKIRRETALPTLLVDAGDVFRGRSTSISITGWPTSSSTTRWVTRPWRSGIMNLTRGHRH